MIEIIKGNILDAKEKYIAHQCNAVSNQAGGLAHYIFKKFPYADIYKGRPFPYKASGINFPGHCVIKGDGLKDRFVINIIAQYYPGTPRPGGNLLDGPHVREGYFNRCLFEISRMENIDSIAFPLNIGCGMAGGDWEKYNRMIQAFAIGIKLKQNARIVFYDYEQA